MSSEAQKGRVDPTAVPLVGADERVTHGLRDQASNRFVYSQRLALDLGGSLEALHNMCLVHGALRHRNVTVLADGRVKLFFQAEDGIRDALPLDSVLASGPPAEYLAPEQIRGAPTTEKTDI